mgnify:CR=1 FL=1
MALSKIERRKRIHYRIRKHVNGTAERPRLVVFRSNRQIYAQVINDETATTLVAAASNDKVLAAECKAVAARAIEKGINEVAFDRGGYLYHGRVKSLADAAREGGLKF